MEQDQDNRNRRHMGIKGALQLLMMILAVAAIVWRGGEMTNQLSTIGASVTKIESRVENAFEKQAKTTADIQVLQERGIVHNEKLQNHEVRIGQLENGRRVRE